MKAIPDQRHSHEIPTSFRQSYRLLKNDFGKRYIAGMVAFLVGGILVWIFVNSVEARVIYFAIAAFHGYLEMAGLCFGRFTK